MFEYSFGFDGYFFSFFNFEVFSRNFVDGLGVGFMEYKFFGDCYFRCFEFIFFLKVVFFKSCVDYNFDFCDL